jgi:hypothetical protein
MTEEERIEFDIEYARSSNTIWKYFFMTSPVTTENV